MRRIGLALLMVFVATMAFAAGQEEAATEERGLVGIEFWHDWAPDGAQGTVLQGLMDEFNDENEDSIEVTLVFMGGKRNEKIAAALAANDAPDVAWISGAGESYYEAGKLIDMDRVYNDDVIEREDVLETLRVNQQFLGEDITLPFENSSLALYYNKAMLDEAGIEYPSIVPGEYTWDDFIRDAATFTDVSEGKYGWHPRWSAAMLSIWLWEAGGEHFSEDGKTNLVANDPTSGAAMLKALERLNRILWVDPITANDVGDQGFNNGDMAYEITGPWAMPRYLKPQGNFESGDIGVAPIPADEDTGLSISYWYQKALALFKTNEDQEWATIEFIDWFYSAPVHATWCADAGYLPVTQSALDHPIWAGNAESQPWVNVFVDQVETMRRRPAGLPYGDLNKLRDIVRFQEGTPEEALEVYRKDAQALLDEFWAIH